MLGLVTFTFLAIIIAVLIWLDREFTGLAIIFIIVAILAHYALRII